MIKEIPYGISFICSIFAIRINNTFIIMYIRGWYALILLIFTCLLIGCDGNQKKISEIDQKLTVLYDRGCDISDSLEFRLEFESALSNPRTFFNHLDSLSTRMKIKQFNDIKSYELAMPECTKVSESFVVQSDEDCIYIQYQGEDKNAYWLKIAEINEGRAMYRTKEWVRDIYTLDEQGKKYYAVVTFLYNEEDELQTEEDSGGMIRVYRKDGNVLVKTNELFPSRNMFNEVLSLRMDNFAFDPKTKTVSYDEYGYTPGVDGDMKVIGRIEWQLRYH